MPTQKQVKAFIKSIENNGNISKSMREVGYGTSSKNPQSLTKSKGWQELMRDYLPDKMILRTHKAGFKATKVITSPTEPDYEIPDHPTRLKAVELAYKVKGKLQDTMVNETKILVMPAELGEKYKIQSVDER